MQGPLDNASGDCGGDLIQASEAHLRLTPLKPLEASGGIVRCQSDTGVAHLRGLPADGELRSVGCFSGCLRCTEAGAVDDDGVARLGRIRCVGHLGGGVDQALALSTAILR